jgi:peptidoglycan hydrolase-like protein with peptidoglycan-binding domain
LLYRGSEGPQVAQLQRQLKYGYEAYAGNLAVDGAYGPQTEAAVREIQRRTRGLKVDGVVGPLTAATLKLRLVPPAQQLLSVDDERD